MKLMLPLALRERLLSEGPADDEPLWEAELPVLPDELPEELPEELPDELPEDPEDE